jgi:FkbM family methyltransferase
MAVRPAPILSVIRERFHPLYHARRVRLIRTALAEVDRPLWARIEGVRWPVRVRAVRHASYLLRSTAPEREVAALACAIVDMLPVERFVDVGSNFGFYSWLLKSRSPSLTVHLVEPETDNLALIDATLSRTPLKDVHVHRLAASDASGHAVFQRDVVSGATGMLGSPGDSYAEQNWGVSAATDVRTAKLDDLLDGRVDLMKIDVEGHEERVLAGASTLLDHDPPILLFECFHGRTAAAAALENVGYKIFDAERFAEPVPSTKNYLGLPSTSSGRVPELRNAWKSLLGA